MQILTINNRNFQKPSRKPSNRAKLKILKKKIFGQLIKKIWFRVCSVTAKMFEHRNSGEKRRKRSEIFFENFNSKLSHACVPLKVPKREIFDCSDFPDFYTIKSLRVGDFGVKIKKCLKNIQGFIQGCKVPYEYAQCIFKEVFFLSFGHKKFFLLRF